MEGKHEHDLSNELNRIVESAARLGIELNEADALQWLSAMAAHQAEDEVTVDKRRGIFGHRIVMLDFDPQDLARFRELGRIVEIPDQPGVVETALALSGSSAQSKIQSYPGDADFFERVNIIAERRSDACAILSEVMRDKALETGIGPVYQLIEVKFGQFPSDLVVDDQLKKSGSPISWRLFEIEQGKIEAHKVGGEPALVTWEGVSDNPGWCKFDWVVVDKRRGQLANASNMLDVTWEAPDGTIIPLDGFLDPYFQEVYLDAGSIPIFSKLAQHVSADAMDEYVSQLEHEVRKYLDKDAVNYGKAAKRMYNIFRLTGRYDEAALLRELFDEPASALYQVWSLIRTIDDCCKEGSSIDSESKKVQADKLILSVVGSLEGEQELEIVRQLLQLRDALTRQEPGTKLRAEAEAARASVINLVNNFYYAKLTAIPSVKDYLLTMQPGE